MVCRLGVNFLWRSPTYQLGVQCYLPCHLPSASEACCCASCVTTAYSPMVSKWKLQTQNNRVHNFSDKIQFQRHRLLNMPYCHAHDASKLHQSVRTAGIYFRCLPVFAVRTCLVTDMVLSVLRTVIHQTMHFSRENGIGLYVDRWLWKSTTHSENWQFRVRLK